MRLKKLKLSGFKSFVDPTTVLFPSHRVGVVGPNGCGKSNIIDAVRWVMGEISAKTLRGSTMSDIIFNGSSNRKPVGQASVELIFDNTETRLTGEYSQHAEISIRRLVSRDGQSQYYLNGTRCRRKDIADVFLGTGLSTRNSYAIIGQNTVSQLVEAKPNDLRLYIEEAANISKYKDRRSDAQTRMENTRDNLCRLSDIREELNKQVARLERQAKAATQYSEWKTEAQKLQIECDVMRWKQWHQALEKQETSIQHNEIQCENLLHERQAIQEKTIAIKTQYQQAHDIYREKQSHYYNLGMECTRLKESLAHQSQQCKQFTFNRERIEKDLYFAVEHVKKEEHQYQYLSEEIAELTPKLAEFAQAKEASEKALSVSEQEKQAWQKEWERFNQITAESLRKSQVLQTQVLHAEKMIQQTEERLKQYEKEQNSLKNISEIEKILRAWEKEEIHLKQEWDTLKKSSEECTQMLLEHRKQQEEKQRAVDSEHKKLQQLQGEITALNALQEAALGKKEDGIKQWLQQQSFANALRVAQHLEVEEHWATAVEYILGQRLQGICLENFEALGDLEQFTHSLSKGECTVVDMSYKFSLRSFDKGGGREDFNFTPLLDHIRCPDALKIWFSSIYIADNLEHAKNLLPLLQAHESFITPQGAWLGKNFLQWTKGKQLHQGLLQREQTIKTLKQTIEQQKKQCEESQQAHEQSRIMTTTYESQREKLSEEIQQAHQKWLNHSTQIRIKRNQLESIQERQRQLEKNVLEQQASLKHSLEQKNTLHTEWKSVSEETQKNEQSREKHTETRSMLYKKHEAFTLQLQKDRENWHALDVKLTRLNAEKTALQTNIAREKENKQSLEKRREQSIASLQKAEIIEQDLQKQYQTFSQQHMTEAAFLEEADKALKHLDEQLKNNEKNQSELDEKISTLHTELEKKRLDAQTLKVKCENIEELPLDSRFRDNNGNILIEDLPEDISIPLWEKKIETLNNKTQQLGAINLAALEEFTTESARKHELDEQYEDLSHALEMLEDAIQTIDKETRERFQETYHKINEAFQALFPRLFGGGRAYLDLTHQDALEAGITIMAQPPGKKNSSIHLLSGGEKAMTAIALVFAIFQLNPSPFCLLDEVDAPLDDMNVGRFCDMVKEMSEQVQFIFITHNKITMELATHLSGVTMREPGVSRLVSVDIEKAISLAEEV